jgi:molecular chaperone GrpE
MQNDDAPASPVDTSSAPVSDDVVRRERDDYYDRLLRVTAEFDNYRKRTDRERRERSEAAGMDVIRDLLPVLDDLERALAAPIDANANVSVREGIELIHRQLLDVVRRRGVEPFDVVGQIFDPEWHEAVANEPANGRTEGEITAELRRGYRAGQRLVRAPMVRVAKT